jgi:lysophospholipase L1-like esterase
MSKRRQRYQFIIIVLAFSTLCSIYACKKDNAPDNSAIITDSNSIPNPPVVLKKMLALGDSYTIGQGVINSERFPNQTINKIRANGILMDYPGSIVAQTGWTTRNLLNGISTAAPNLQPPYDLVTLLIGVNNQYQRRDTNEYKIEFAECLNKAIAYSGNRPQRVFVLSIPDYGVTPFGMANAAQIALEIDRFNRINKEICINNGIDYTDITTSTRLAANDPDLICYDSLHPSGIEYEKWAELLAPKMIPLLR